jgi:hypothetical protein
MRVGNYITTLQDGVFTTVDVRGGVMRLQELPRDQHPIACYQDGAVCSHSGPLYLIVMVSIYGEIHHKFIDTNMALTNRLAKFVEYWNEIHAAIQTLPQPIAEEIIRDIAFKLDIYHRANGIHYLGKQYGNPHHVFSVDELPSHW